ncbi:MAG: phosphoglucosamine mutase [Dehalococcoidales bacterium]|nr:phosphoglucosamine mutase [Dehalococcoidales bacterium]
MQLFGTSGIRRVADKSLVELALKAGLAVGEVYSTVVVGCDTRTSGDAIKHAFVAGLTAAGSQCCDAGVIPTPTLAWAAKEFQAGAMITASHNPPEYNGIKLLNPDGSAFDTRQRERIEDMILSDSSSIAPWNEMKKGSIYNGAIEGHIQHILEDFPEEYRLKIVLDCGCGAASVITPYLLKKLGCEVLAINCYPCGYFPHDIEPTEANLEDLIRATTEFSADLGIAHDGDGDRMMAVDDKGRFIPGDKLLAIFAKQMGAKKVVTTIDASMVIDEMGFSVARTKVGDIYVSDELKAGGDFGGEPSGSWIFPENSLCPDGIYAAAEVVAIASQRKLSSLVDEIPSYPIIRGSMINQGLIISDLQTCLLSLKPTSMSNMDGIKLNFKDGWLLIRVSGTEPKIRVTAEAINEERVHQLYDSGIELIRKSLKDTKEE